MKVPIGFRYTFSKKRFTPYVTLGISSTFHLDSKSSWNKETTSQTGGTTILNHEAITIKNDQLGYWAAIGLAKSYNKKLSYFVNSDMKKQMD